MFNSECALRAIEDIDILAIFVLLGSKGKVITISSPTLGVDDVIFFTLSESRTSSTSRATSAGEVRLGPIPLPGVFSITASRSTTVLLLAELEAVLLQVLTHLRYLTTNNLEALSFS
ncbi:MAG: hypothetical protein EBT15_12395 [Betaproteobacteria bacterium]|nr:hypothetical protein [Betaproteobacteria bacterium]